VATYPQGVETGNEREILTWQPEEFEELGQELRRRMGSEVREEAEELERLSDLGRRRRQPLIEVIRSAMHRGAAVGVSLAGASFTGQVVSVGSDYVQLDCDGQTLEFPMDRGLISIEPSRSGGMTGRPASATWRARLSELAAAQRPVRLLISGSEPCEGVIEVVAPDHVQVRAGGLVYLPLIRIEGLTRRPEEG
jgi:hypothetical protein